MRRTDREVTDPARIRQILWDCHCCRLGFCDEGGAYIVPLDFGYVEQGGRRTFYFHGAREGRKIELIAKNRCAGFELDTNYELIRGDTACGHSARYQSIIGTGRVSFVEDLSEKRAALQAVMLHSSGKDGWEFPDVMLRSVCVFKLEVRELSCKEHL